MSAPGRKTPRVALGVLGPLLALVLVAVLWRLLQEEAPGAGPAAPAPAGTPAQGARPAAAAADPSATGPRPSTAGAPGAARAALATGGGAAPAGGHFSLAVDGGVPPELVRLVPEVLRCAEDQVPRAPGRLALDVAYTPTDGGHFARVSVRSSWQDPYLTACVEDVFEELGFTPSPGTSFAPSAVRFSLVR